MTTALASTAYYRIGIIVDADDNTLARISQIATQMIVLLSMIIILWREIRAFFYLLSDIFTTIDYTMRIVAIIINSVGFVLR